MEQEQILDRGARVTLETGKQLFQFLAYAAQQLYKTYDEQKQLCLLYTSPSPRDA